MLPLRMMGEFGEDVGGGSANEESGKSNAHKMALEDIIVCNGKFDGETKPPPCSKPLSFIFYIVLLLNPVYFLEFFHLDDLFYLRHSGNNLP